MGIILPCVRIVVTSDKFFSANFILGAEEVDMQYSDMLKNNKLSCRHIFPIISSFCFSIKVDALFDFKCESGGIMRFIKVSLRRRRRSEK